MFSMWHCLTMLLIILPVTDAHIAINRNPHDCKSTRTGQFYNGTIAQTAKGERCITWNEAKRYKNNVVVWSDYKLDEDQNYCRNIDDDQLGPWCFVWITVNKYLV